MTDQRAVSLTFLPHSYLRVYRLSAGIRSREPEAEERPSAREVAPVHLRAGRDDEAVGSVVTGHGDGRLGREVVLVTVELGHGLGHHHAVVVVPRTRSDAAPRDLAALAVRRRAVEIRRPPQMAEAERIGQIRAVLIAHPERGLCGTVARTGGSHEEVHLRVL